MDNNGSNFPDIITLHGYLRKDEVTTTRRKDKVGDNV
jgi:hypothetical protein